MQKLPISVIIVIILVIAKGLLAYYADKKIKTSIAQRIDVSKTHGKRQSGWLADLSVLPSIEQVEKLSEHVDEVMQRDKNPKCKAVNPRLRKMIFLHFVTYQYMANKKGIYIPKKAIKHWAHIFGILLKESSGDTTNVTSMTGRTFTTYQAKSDLNRWRKIFNLEEQSNIKLNSQTNFGLTQLSADRLFISLDFSIKPVYLRGRNIKINTAIAIRRLLWFYQDFAQGRLTHAQDRIHSSESGSPEYASRLQTGVSMALLFCGTNYMFHEGYNEKSEGQAELTKAMSSIAYCRIGDNKIGFGKSEENERCFAKWVTLCPTLNFDIAMLTPLSYFATRKAAPVCQETFEDLRIEKGKKKKTHHKKEPVKVEHETPQPSPGKRVKDILNAASSLIKNIFVAK